MDAQAWFGLFGGGSLLVTIGIAIGLSRSRSRVLDELDHRFQNLDNWRLNLLPITLDNTFVRQKELALELKHLHDALQRIEAVVATILRREESV